MEGPDGQLHVLVLDDAGDLDLGGGDHLDVDPRRGQGLEHLGGDAGVRRASRGRRPRPWRPRRRGSRRGRRCSGGRSRRRSSVSARSSRGTVKLTSVVPLGRDVLHDHVDDDAVAAIVRKSCGPTPGRSGTPRIVTRASSLIEGRPGDRRRPPCRRPPATIQVPGRSVNDAADVDRHAVLLGELDRPGVHDAGPQAGQLEHLVVADAVDLAGLGHDAAGRSCRRRRRRCRSRTTSAPQDGGQGDGASCRSRRGRAW